MKKYIIVTVISAIIIQSLALFGAFAGNLNGNNVFTLDFNGASALGPVTGENDAVTNTWLSEAYNQNCINFYFEPGVTEEFSIESGLFGKNASDKALRIKGYDGNNNTRMGISPWGVNPAYNNAASIDCGANGSFVFSFDFATSNLLSPAQIASARTIEFVRGILTERQTYGQGLFSLKADGSIQIFNDVITADEIKAAIGKNITENEWYTIKIVFNASNQMGLLINGKVVRQMATLTNASATSSLRALGVELRFYANLGKDASLTEEQAKLESKYFDNISYEVLKNQLVTELTEEYPLSLSFKGYGEKASFPSWADRIITPEISSGYGIEKVEVYVSGTLLETLTEEPYDIDLNSCGLGEYELKAVAYDTNGKTVEDSIVISSYAEYNKELWSEYFEGYKTGDSSFSGITIVNQRGYAEAAQLDDEHGNSLRVGIHEVANDFKGAGAMAQFTNPAPSGNVVLEADVYIEQKASNADPFRFALKKASSTELIAVDLGQVALCGGETLSFEAEEWHKLKINVNVPMQTLSVYLDGVPVKTNHPISNLDQLNLFRLYGPTNPGPSSMIIDNVTISSSKSYTISSVDDNNEVTSGEISPETDSLKVYIPSAVLTSSFSEDSFLIESENGSVKVSDALFDETEGCILLLLENKLVPATTYHLSVADTLQTDEGDIIGEPLRYSFKTAKSPFYADVSFDGLYVNVNFSNSLSENKTAYIVATVWDGSEYKDMFVKEVLILGGMDTNEPIEITSAEEGDTIRAFVWDSLTKPENVSEKVYTFTK